MERLRTLTTWYLQTSTLLGIPVLLMLLCVAVQKVFFTGTCLLAGFQCQYSFGSSQAIESYVNNLISQSPEGEVTFKKRK